MVLSKNQLLGRDDNGELVPVKIDLPALDDFVMMYPVTRGKLQAIQTSYLEKPDMQDSIDADLLIEHLASPKLTKEEYDTIPVTHIKHLMQALLSLSGVEKQVEDSNNSAIAAAEVELKKK